MTHSSKFYGAVCNQNHFTATGITSNMGSHSVTYHLAAVTFSPLPQPKLVLDLATPEGCKAELTWWWLVVTGRGVCEVLSFTFQSFTFSPPCTRQIHTLIITAVIIYHSFPFHSRLKMSLLSHFHHKRLCR